MSDAPTTSAPQGAAVPAAEGSAPEASAEEASTGNFAARKRASLEKLRAKAPVRERAEPETSADDDGDVPELGDLSDEDIAALSDGRRAAPKTPKAAGDTIMIGGVEVPVSALSELPDDVLRKIKRKVWSDGGEREVSLAEALEAVPQADGWQRRQWEAAQQRKQLAAIVQRMHDDPVGAMTQVLGSSDAVYAKIMEQLEYDGLPPKERARIDEERRLRQRAARADEYERREQEQQTRAAVERSKATYTASMESALKAAGVPVTQYAIRRMAHAIGAEMDEGILSGEPSPADFARAAKLAAKEYEEERAAWLDGDGEALIAHLGEERARKVARAFAQRMRAAQKTPERRPTPGAAPRSSPAERPKSWEEFFAERDRRLGIRR